MAELVLDARNGTGESPVWHAGEQALYWVDIPGRAIHRWSPAQGHRQWATEEMPACLAATATSGRWLAGMESGLFALTLGEEEQANASRLATTPHSANAMRLNDGRCDRQGRFWAGSMCLDMAAGLRAGAWYRFGAGDAGALPAQLTDFIVPNGLAFSPDGRTMYVSDSHSSVQAIWAFDYDVDSGTPHNRRLFVDMKPLPGRPDGAAIDVDGGYWICGNDAGLVHRFTPDGRLDRSLPVPVKKPAMCAFGGPRLDTLYVTSIRPGGDLGDQPLAGGVFALQPLTQGLPEPAFAG